MSIVKLTIKNFLSIQDVEIVPGKINQIFGSNNQGKTTILKALEFAFKGSNDASLIRHGQDQAEVIVELDNETTIRRKLYSYGKQDVKVKKGEFVSNAPQNYLNTLFDGISFNPLEILNPKTRTQFILRALNLKMTQEELSEISGIDLNSLPPLDYEKENALIIVEQAYKYFYARRAEVNKVSAEKKKRWETYKADLPPMTSLPTAKDSIYETMSIIEEKKAVLIGKKLEIDRRNKDREASIKKIVEWENELNGIDDSIVALKAQYEKALAVLEERKSNGKKLLDEKKCMTPQTPHSTMDLEEGIKAFNDDLEKYRLALKDCDIWEAQEKQRKTVDDMKMEYEKEDAVATVLDKRVNSLGAEAKKKIMQKAELPVQGLTYSDGEFFLNGSSLDHLSSSASLRLALALVKKMADKTKLICIDGAELLDQEAFAAFKLDTEKDDYTYFFTKVGEPFLGSDKTFLAHNGQLTQETNDGSAYTKR